MKYKTRFAAFFAAMTLFNLAANFAHPVTPTVIKNLNLHDYMFGLALAAMLFTNFLSGFRVFTARSNFSHSLAKQKTPRERLLFGRGRKIRTFGMTESESVALPLGDTP